MTSSERYTPLTAATWADFEQVMGPCQGGDGGCWCTWWRLPRGEWQRLGRDGRKPHFKRMVEAGTATGIIAFENAEAYGWCAIAPAEDYPVIARSSVVKPSLQPGDWYVSCFFVKAGYRRKQAMRRLLGHAIAFAKAHGARAIEACPRDQVAASGTSDLFVGKTTVFVDAGFQEIHRLRHDRPLLRLLLVK